MQTVNAVDSALNQQAKERSCAKKALPFVYQTVMLASCFLATA